jgi:hypothetical protein
MVHTFSLKVGKKFGYWQFKYEYNHDKVLFTSMRFILNKTCLLLGYDYEDRDQVYLCSVSAEPFDGYHLALSRAKEKEGYDGCVYRVAESRIGDFDAESKVPSFIREKYLITWPETMYMKLEKTSSSAIIN